MNEDIKKLGILIEEAENIVFFGGAGVSTESGIPDFRGVGGLYNQKFKYPPEYMLSHSFFMEHTEEFYEFYRSKILLGENIKPNDAHTYLAGLEKQGKLKAVITQNIDGLHQAAGSKNVLELHGSVFRNYCVSCGKFYKTDFTLKGVPRCVCGGIIKPDVVLYEESLNNETLEKVVDYISNAELLIVGGTSLSVYPAAGLIRCLKGKLVIINQSSTGYDDDADLLIAGSIGKVFKELQQ